jgi:hypothetical protein
VTRIDLTFLTATAFLAAVGINGARADGFAPIERPVTPIARPVMPIVDPKPLPAPVDQCRPVENPQLREQLSGLAENIQRSVACGEAQALLEDAAQLQQLARDLIASSTDTGNCFSNKDCARPKLTGGWTTKEACKTAGGSSWQQENPTEGSCENL